MIRRIVIVDGRVQGVGFRWSAANEARRLGIAGHVLNRADGTVEADIEGDDLAVAAMQAWLAHGPRGAVVSGTSVTEADPSGAAGFGIVD